MSYDEDLAERVREVVASATVFSEKKMFGGLAFLVHGHMAVAASSQGGLLLRCDPTETDTLVQQPHVGRFVMRGREMSGWLRIDPEAVGSDADLRRWVEVGVAYARSLPPK